MKWLLDKELAKLIESSRAAGINVAAAAGFAARGNSLGKLFIEGNIATIPIDGVLTDKFDPFAAFFGGGNTVYGDIVDAINKAEADDNIETIYLNIRSSPGGKIDGLIKVMDAIKAATKPVHAIVDVRATSAAYFLASQADDILAVDRMTEVGSLGAAVDT